MRNTASAIKFEKNLAGNLVDLWHDINLLRIKRNVDYWRRWIMHLLLRNW